eukprot:m.107549 g.107549  ORF g.107549 m.107549 type:complete len:57 (+) comp37303_c0_seq7:4651-4821(+)
MERKRSKRVIAVSRSGLRPTLHSPVMESILPGTKACILKNKLALYSKSWRAVVGET